MLSLELTTRLMAEEIHFLSFRDILLTPTFVLGRVFHFKSKIPQTSGGQRRVKINKGCGGEYVDSETSLNDKMRAVINLFLLNGTTLCKFNQ